MLVYGVEGEQKWAGHGQIHDKIREGEFEEIVSIDEKRERQAEMEVLKEYCHSRLHRLLLQVWYMIPENRTVVEQRATGIVFCLCWS